MLIHPSAQSLLPPAFLVRLRARGELRKAGSAATSVSHPVKVVYQKMSRKSPGLGGGWTDGRTLASSHRQTGWCRSIVLSGQTFVWHTIDWGTSGKSAQLRLRCNLSLSSHRDTGCFFFFFKLMGSAWPENSDTLICQKLSQYFSSLLFQT